MFVDASALLAMMLDEDEARLLGARLQTSTVRMTSPMETVVASVGLQRHLGLEAEASADAVTRFLAAMGIKVVSVPAQVVPAAMEALARFGALSGSREGLDAAACLTYATARYFRVPLLHRDPRLAATDIASA